MDQTKPEPAGQVEPGAAAGPASQHNAPQHTTPSDGPPATNPAVANDKAAADGINFRLTQSQFDSQPLDGLLAGTPPGLSQELLPLGGTQTTAPPQLGTQTQELQQLMQQAERRSAEIEQSSLERRWQRRINWIEAPLFCCL